MRGTFHAKPGRRTLPGTRRLCGVVAQGARRTCGALGVLLSHASSKTRRAEDLDVAPRPLARQPLTLVECALALIAAVSPLEYALTNY